MSAEEPRPRRSNYTEMPLSYGAVGASKHPDLMKFPPVGTTPYEHAVRLGSGHERFVLAGASLMTWGAQRRAKLELSRIVPGDGGNYSGVQFSSQGEPQPAAEPELHYGPDGEAYLTVGTRLTVQNPGANVEREMLVLYTVDEPRRTGFAWGSVTAEQAIGEELFTVELRTDDSVWAVARGFVSAPTGGLFGLKGKALVKDAIELAKTQIEALAPGYGKTDGSGR